MLTQKEGIIPGMQLSSRVHHNSNSTLALESSHAIWEAVNIAKTLPKDHDIVVVGIHTLSIVLRILTCVILVSIWPW